MLRIFSFLVTFVSVLFNAAAVAQNYKIAHCYRGCPLGGSSENHLIIRPIYALSFNTTTKSADWVSYTVSPESIGIASSLSRAPIADEYVSETLKQEDFFNSEIQGLIRAQYVPLVDFAGSPYWNEVNYLTNTVARTSSLSQGAWYGLDWSIRNYVNRRRKGDEEESCVGGVGDVGGVGVDPPPRGNENFDENDDEKNSVVVVVVVLFFFFFFFSVVVIKVFVAKNEKRSRRRIGNPSATHAIKGEVILAGEKLRGGTHRPRV